MARSGNGIISISVSAAFISESSNVMAKEEISMAYQWQQYLAKMAAASAISSAAISKSWRRRMKIAAMAAYLIVYQQSSWLQHRNSVACKIMAAEAI